MTDAVSAISSLLYNNWNLTSPDKNSIYWAKGRFETVDFAKVGKSNIVACYQLMANVKGFTFETWQVEETVAIDILSKESSLRNDMREEVYRIIHANEHAVSGYVWVHIVREANSVESIDLARTTIHVACLSWKTKP